MSRKRRRLVVDQQERARVQRARRAEADGNLAVDAELVVRLIDSGSAPAILAGELFRRADHCHPLPDDVEVKP